MGTQDMAAYCAALRHHRSSYKRTLSSLAELAYQESHAGRVARLLEMVAISVREQRYYLRSLPKNRKVARILAFVAGNAKLLKKYAEKFPIKQVIKK